MSQIRAEPERSRLVLITGLVLNLVYRTNIYFIFYKGTNEKYYRLDELLRRPVATPKHPFNCQYCVNKRRANNSNSLLINLFSATQAPSITSYPSPSVNQFNDQTDYSSYSYLVTLAPIFLCVARCEHKGLEMLIEYGACANVQDRDGNTPLHLATAKTNIKCDQCIYLLIKSHAFVLVKNNVDFTPVGILKSNFLINQTYNKIFNDIFNKNTICKSLSSSTTVTNTGTTFSGSSTTSGLNKSHAIAKVLNSFGNSQTNTLLSTNSSTHNRITNHDRNKSLSHTNILGNNEGERSSCLAFAVFENRLILVEPSCVFD
jgi:hypothetical protein